MWWMSELNWSTLLVGSVAFVALIALINARRRPKNFPPGPRGLPFLGYISYLGKNAGESIRKLKAKYGPVMSMQLGMEDFVVLNDFDSINEALVKQGEKFSGRPSNYMFDMLTEGHGVGVADYGPVWKSLRKFGLMTLRGFGVGKKGMEENVIEETPYLIDYLTSHEEDDIGFKMTLAVSNIISRVVFGSRFSYDDKRFRRMIRILRDLQTGDNEDAKYFGVVAAVPFLRHFPPFKGALARLKEELNVRPAIFREIIAEHKASLDENDVRDFIDAFLLEIKKRGKTDPAFSEQQLVSYIRDLFDAGTGTTSSTLVWMILIFANHLEYQENIYKEIETVIGDSRPPSMKDRDEMPYTRAFIYEVTRYKTLVPTGVFHKTNAEAIVNGYTIPKETTIIPNTWSVHFDPELFPNPNEFRPERFLDKDGKFVKSNHIIPFSIGPRHCLGEQLAVMELFIFLVGIVQKLKIVPDPDHPLPPINYDEYMVFNALEAPPFKAKFERR